MRLKNLYLSHWKDAKEVYVPESVVVELKNYHYDSVRFLYNCYKKKSQGAILNEDADMNFPIQISAFLRAIKSKIDGKILVVATQTSVLAWHYHLSNHAGLSPKIATLENVDDISDENVLLATATDLKLLQSLAEQDFEFTVVEDFDVVVNRLVLKKLRGAFNIGLTCRNFVLNPDFKLMWKMLSWCNPVVTGKIDEFLETGFDSDYNLFEPHSNFWLRITWKFSENFKKDSVEEKQVYLNKLESWAVQNNLKVSDPVKKKRKSKKQNSEDDENDTETELDDNDKNKRVNTKRKTVKKPKSNSNLPKKTTKRTRQMESEPNKPTKPKHNKPKVEDVTIKKDSDSSQDTIISDNDYSEYQEYIQLPSMDENPILNSIVKNFESPDVNTPEIKKETEGNFTENSVLSFLFDRPSTSKLPETTAIEEDTNKEDDSDNEILSSILR